MDGRGGGDRTKSAVETSQVIDSIKREKRHKPAICPTEVHPGTRFFPLATMVLLKLNLRSKKKTTLLREKREANQPREPIRHSSLVLLGVVGSREWIPRPLHRVLITRETKGNVVHSKIDVFRKPVYCVIDWVGAVGIVLRSRVETTNYSFYVTRKTPKTPTTLKSLKTGTRRRQPPVPFIFFLLKTIGTQNVVEV